MRVVLAGTFGPIHDGHRRLFREALQRGDEGVVLGVTTDEFAAASRREDPRPVPPFGERVEAVRHEVAEIDEWGREVKLRSIDDEYGFADDDPSLDGVVVSPETDEEIERLNRQRVERGMDPLQRIVVPYALAEDGNRISSTRIARGEIDEHGNLCQE